MMIMFWLHSGNRILWLSSAQNTSGANKHLWNVVFQWTYRTELFVLRRPGIFLSFLGDTQRLWKAFYKHKDHLQPSTEVKTRKSPECLCYMTYLFLSPQYAAKLQTGLLFCFGPAHGFFILSYLQAQPTTWASVRSEVSPWSSCGRLQSTPERVQSLDIWWTWPRRAHPILLPWIRKLWATVTCR